MTFTQGGWRNTQHTKANSVTTYCDGWETKAMLLNDWYGQET